MTTISRTTYAEKALAQIPRLLSNQDRNPLSPTYGCFHRDYWLDKTSDFPDAVRQFAVQALALVYAHEFPGSPYYGQPKIRDWAIAGLSFWAGIQHHDGSFDEFYPYERGWVGPTAFTTFASIEAFQLLRNEIPSPTADRILRAIRQAAYFICRGQQEEDHLANHHAMAYLAVWKAYALLQEPALKRGAEQRWQEFLSYHNTEEGWSREYDGVDPGYLSATISFLAKIYQINPDPALLEVMQQSATFCSYVVYPNGFYAGSIGSRNTLHAYPHGFEVLAASFPLAAAIAEKLLHSLAEGKLVPPEIMSDRYVAYRVPEFLQSYLDYAPRPPTLPPLPYEEERSFTRYFRKAGVFVANYPRAYVVANLAKGGVVKVFDRQSGELLLNDCGCIGKLATGKLLSSQWIAPHTIIPLEWGFSVSGQLQFIPSNRLFTPLTHLAFRTMLVASGWNASFSHLLKGSIRKMLILGNCSGPIMFHRTLTIHSYSDHSYQVILSDTLLYDGHPTPSRSLVALSLGDEFAVRYVPQSRYFQSQELGMGGWQALPAHLDALNRGEILSRTIRIAMRDIPEVQVEIRTEAIEAMGTTDDKTDKTNPDDMLPSGVYGHDYYVGRQTRLPLIYRLKRRTQEVHDAITRYWGQDAPHTIVDIGTADSLMLEYLKDAFPKSTLVGVDMSIALLQARNPEGIGKILGDAQQIPLAPACADVVIATAIIEHLAEPAQMLRACATILRPGGLFIMTTPDPLCEHLATRVGLLNDAGHHYTFSLATLQTMLEQAGFAILEARKFMLSPIGLPAEKFLEQCLRTVRLDLLMANQLIVAQKPGEQDADHTNEH